jgi:hypothetical protein
MDGYPEVNTITDLIDPPLIVLDRGEWRGIGRVAGNAMCLQIFGG